MRKILLLLVLFPLVLKAQLYIKPSSQDNYLFVDNTFLFVNQNVDLQLNYSDDLKASIYLRNNGQLLQGDPLYENSGDGLLSVYQNSQTDSYDYTTWGPPISHTSIAPVGNTKFGILNIYDPNTITQSDQTQTTTARNGIAPPNLTISTRWTYTRPALSDWVRIYANYAVPTGMGVIMKGVGETFHNDPYVDPQNTTFDFRGRPNTGDIWVNVAVGPESITCSGNPYPSALDLNLFFNDPENDEIDSLMYWDEKRDVNSHLYRDNKGGYATWVPGPAPYTNGGLYVRPNYLHYDDGGNPIGDTGIDGPYAERLFAPIGQGFFIKPLSSGQVVFRNSHRVFVREGEPFSEFRTQQPSILRLQAIFGQSHFRELLLCLHPNSTLEYERGLDASHPMDGPRGDVYFPIGEDSNYKKAVIQTVPYSPGLRIPINFKLTRPFRIFLKTVEEINLPLDSVYLWDSSTNEYYQINGEEVTEINLGVGEYEGRYYIVFRNNPNREVQKNEFILTHNDNTLTIHNSDKVLVNEIELYLVNGNNQRVFYSNTNNDKIYLPTYGLPQGIYIVTINKSFNKKVIIK